MTIHTRESVLARIAIGPAQFIELAGTTRYRAPSRVAARAVVDALVGDGVARWVSIGEYKYLILDTDAGMQQAVRQAIDERTMRSACGCLHWTGYMGGTTVAAEPKMRIPGAVRGAGPVNVRRMLWSRANDGQKLGPHEIVRMSCDDNLCIDPRHMVVTKRNAKQVGRRKTKTQITRMTETQRARSKRLDIDRVREIRAGGGTLRETAERYGVSMSTISLIRLGRIWREMPAGHFAGLMR